jgi:hypothetical protein
VFEAERPKLVRYTGRFDGFHSVPAAVSKTCLVRFDSNKYSVAANAVGRPVEVHAYADRIVIRQDGRIPDVIRSQRSPNGTSLPGAGAVHHIISGPLSQRRRIFAYVGNRSRKLLVRTAEGGLYALESILTPIMCS